MDNTYFMGQALALAENALAHNEFPVGCVIVHNDRILATGARTGSSGPRPNEIDHAEMVALRRLSVLPQAQTPEKLRLFCTLEPCLMCFGAILLSGIGEIVYAYEDVMGGGTACQTDTLTPLYRDHKIGIIAHVQRQASLKLFQAFFASTDNHYWQDSLLARYTLAQK